MKMNLSFRNTWETMELGRREYLLRSLGSSMKVQSISWRECSLASTN